MNKPGYKTTEFWLTLGGTVVALLVGYGVLTQDEADQWLKLLAAVLPVLGPVVYTMARSWLKAQEAKVAHLNKEQK